MSSYFIAARVHIYLVIIHYSPVQMSANSLFHKSLVAVSLITAFTVQSCKPSVIAFDEVEYVTSLGSNERFAPVGAEVNLGVIGINDFRIFGPYMVVSTHDDAGLIKIFAKDGEHELLGSFFAKGNGPGELIFSPSTGSFVFKTDSNGDICAEFDNRVGSY